MGLSHPGRGVLGPVGDHQQDAVLRQARDRELEQLLGGGIDPVRIL